MSTIWDHAVRALQPVFHETAARGADAGHPLAYYCGGPNRTCTHQTCAAVSALAEADLLHYPPPDDHDCDLPPGITRSDQPRHTCPDCGTEWTKSTHRGLNSWRRTP